MAFHYKAWMLALTGCLLASTAMADDNEGAYVFISGGNSFAFHACASPNNPSGSTCTSVSPAFRGGFGYQYTSIWGLEVNYGSFGYASSSGIADFGPPVGVGNYSWQVKALGLAVQAVTTLHMTDEFAVFAKFGIARVEYDEWLGVSSATGNWYLLNPISAKKNSPALAVGIRYDVTPHGSIMLGAEYFGQYDVYNLNKQVRLTSMPTLSLMYKY